MQSKSLTKLFNVSSQKLLHHKGCLLALTESSPVIFINTYIMNFTRQRLFNSLPRSSSLVNSAAITAPSFSTSTKQGQLSSETLSSKLMGQENFTKCPMKFFTRRAEEETLEVKEVGWAGQPVVKRLHTILPEVHGDLSDIFKVGKKSKAIMEVGNNTEVKLRDFGRSHDIIAVINENARNEINVNPSANKTKHRLLHTKQDKIYYQTSGVLPKNPMKLKKKKRTVVLASKPAIVPSSVKNTKHKVKKSRSKKKLSVNKRPRMPPMAVLIRKLSTMPLSLDLHYISNRQFQTFSAPRNAKAAVAVKVGKKVSMLSVTGKPKKGKLKSVSDPIIPADDCVCPEILYTKGKRKSTKICGEAAGAGKGKKKSSWKQKMCLVEPRDDPGRQRTLVCISEAAKLGKRKKELKKCPEPEKKVAPRVIICEPNLEEEAEKKEKKECVKIEEVKIRKRTKVCKPVIIFAKEEVGVQIEKKAVCSSTRIKKVASRHTTICKPTGKK